MGANHALGFLLAGLLILFAAWKAATSTLLKDFSDASPAPYSFSRSQLAWWTVIIGVCIALHFGIGGNYPSFLNDKTALLLLGISAGTAGVASILDQRQDAASAVNGVPRSQDSPSQGWLTDILSDNSGVSVHRFQALVFNAVYGVLYLAKFLADPNSELPQFDDGTLALLGISASAYGFMKSSENQGQTAPAPVPSGGHDSSWVG